MEFFWLFASRKKIWEKTRQNKTRSFSYGKEEVNNSIWRFFRTKGILWRLNVKEKHTRISRLLLEFWFVVSILSKQIPSIFAIYSWQVWMDKAAKVDREENRENWKEQSPSFPILHRSNASYASRIQTYTKGSSEMRSQLGLTVKSSKVLFCCSPKSSNLSSILFFVSYEESNPQYDYLPEKSEFRIIRGISRTHCLVCDEFS